MAFICPKMAQKCLYQGLYQTKFEQHHAKPHLSTSILVYLIRANPFCGLQTEVAVLGGGARFSKKNPVDQEIEEREGRAGSRPCFEKGAMYVKTGLT